MTATRKIIALSRDNVLKKIQLKALMKMHESCTSATLLTNCETWILNKGEREKLSKIELWALKKILKVPVTTPTPAIWYLTGLLMTPINIDKRQLTYLKTILDRPTDDWTPTSWDRISQQASWKNAVITATEQRNRGTHKHVL